MTNWRGFLPAGRELDRLVAERLGWQDIVERQTYLEGYDWDKFCQRLFGKSPNPLYSIGTDIIPEFSTDANAALTLLMADQALLWTLEPITWADGRLHTYECTIQDENGGSLGRGETPALAIARAWLADRERHAQ